jgi:hypothetical protein
MSDEPQNLNDLVVLPGGRTKRLGDLTFEDCMALSEYESRKVIRLEEAARALIAGRAPKCDHAFVKGTFCEADAEVIEGDADCRCAAHGADSSGR